MRLESKSACSGWLCAAILASLVATSGCSGTKQTDMTLTYTPRPDRADILDDGLKVCVSTVDVRWDTEEHDERNNTTLSWTFR